MPPNPPGLRHNDKWMVVSMTPDVCLTPMGGTPVPVPYSIISEGPTSTATEPTVRFTQHEAFTLDSLLTAVKGDEAGSCGGVVSGTNVATCEPIECVATVRAKGVCVIRDGQLFWMNMRNTIGAALYIEQPAAGQDANAAKSSGVSGESGTSTDSASQGSGGSGSSSSGGSSSGSSQSSGAQQGGLAPTNSEGLPLESLADEQANAMRQSYFDRSCGENTPGAYSCGWMHCSNSCVAQRYLFGGSGVLGTVGAVANFALGGPVYETLQMAGGASAIAQGAPSTNFCSPWQLSDLKDDIVGISIGMNPAYAGMSCEQACAGELGGHESTALPEGEGTPRECGPLHPSNPLNQGLKKAGEAIDSCLEAADKIGGFRGAMARAGCVPFP